LAAAAALLAGCRDAQSALAPAADQAAWVFSLLGLMLWIGGAMYVLVLAFLAWAIWRARRPLAAETGTRGSQRGLSISLGVWAGIITMGLTVLSLASFVVDRRVALAGARDAVQVRVTGHQWWWRIQYRQPGGGWVETANELHLPAGRVTHVELGSSDVIHSFWVPNVAGKMDVVPGRINVLDLTPRKPGWYRGQCAEFCGLQHAHMALDVKVEPASDFNAWLAGQAQGAGPSVDPAAVRGKQIVTQGACAACHAVRGSAATGRVGPDLTHIASRRSIAAGLAPFSRGALQGWIAQPNALKPGTMMPAVPLSGADADAVSLYLTSLR